MAQFDEGRVFFSQGQRRDEDEDANGFPARFRAFVTQYQKADGTTLVEQFKRQDVNTLEVEIDDLSTFDTALKDELVDRPTELLPVFEKTVQEIYKETNEKERDDMDEEDGPEEPPKDIQVILHSSLKDRQLGTSAREIRAEKVSRLVQVPGIITAAATPRSKATLLTVQCKDCNRMTQILVKPGMGGAVLPRTCTLSQGNAGAEPCSLDPFQIVAHKSTSVDQQTLKLQERPEDIPTGELPRTMLLVVDKQLVDRVTPGMRVQVLGIYSVYQVSSKGAKKSGAASVRHPYIRVIGIREDASASLHGAIIISPQEKVIFENFAKMPDVHERIYKMIAPEIFGHDLIKISIASLLFGGTRKKMVDGTARRGDINVLLLGDPSTAKSQFLKFASKAAPIAVYTSGKGSSAAGLTAAIIRDTARGEFYLEGGAMVLADNGVVCIDEFDKMRDEDRVAIHEAMEQQTISIAKAGITTMLKSRTAVLAAANPPKGRYDDLKSAKENIDLQTTILSRFDLIFIVKDKRNPVADKRIAEHVLELHRVGAMHISNSGPSQSMGRRQDTSQENVDFLRRYIEFCRKTCFPILSEEAQTLLKQEYVGLRREARQIAESGNGLAVPITVRQLEALVRLSESLAKMELCSQVNEGHVKEALRLFKASTMDALNSGVVDGADLSKQQNEEVKSIENLILHQSLLMGQCASEKRLVGQLTRQGKTESLVRRAIARLLQRGNVRFTSNRQSVLTRVR